LSLPAETGLAMPGGYALRSFRPSDVLELHALVERNREDLAQWMNWAQQSSIEDTREHVARAVARTRDGSGVECAVVHVGGAGATTRESDESAPIVGDVGLYVDRVHACGAVGYWLDADHRGRGAITFATRSLVHHGFTQLALHRVEIRADVRNLASRAVAERLGFQLEGVLRESYRIAENRYSSDVVYSMLASDPQRHRLIEAAGEVLGQTTLRR
jgi:ribosomal-protein-serine acetyltransferase